MCSAALQPKPMHLQEPCCTGFVQSLLFSLSREGGSASHSVPTVLWDGGGTVCPILPTPRDTTSLSSPDRDAQATLAMGCSSQAERCVKCQGCTHNPCSAVW